jgi:polysaccharide biosynthesis transport protein
MDLLYFIKVLFRKKWLILLLTFVALLIASIFLFFKKPLYESLAQYSTGFTSEKVTLFDGSAAVDLYSADVKFNNVIETFKSPRVIGMLSYKLLLHDLENSTAPYKILTVKQKDANIYKAVDQKNAIEILKSKIAKSELLRSDDQTEKNMLEYLKLFKYDYISLREFLFISRVDRTDYLDIVYRSENPELSANVVNTLGQEFINYYKNLNFQRTEKSVESIQQSVTNQERKVDSLGNVLVAAKRRQGSIDPVSTSTSAMETVKELETRLADENSKYNEHKNRLDYLNESLTVAIQGTGGGEANTGGNAEVIRLTNKRNALLNELNSKGGNDPELQKQITDLRTEIALKSNSGSSKLKQKDDVAALRDKISEETALMRAASSTIADYRGKIARYTGMTNVAPGSGVQLDVLKDKYDNENKQLGSIKEKYNQAEGLSKDDPTINFKQTLLGQPAVEPEPRKIITTLGLAGISMLMLSSILFLFLEIFDSSIKTPSNFSKVINLKLATVLNSMKLKNRNVSDIILNENEGNQFLDDNVYKNSIRKLRYEIINSGKKVFLFTSTKKQVGKSTIIEALATSLLLSKNKVLLIDLNMSNNTLTEKFGATIYLQDVASKIKVDLPINSQRVVNATQLDNLSIIGSKEGNYTPSEILYGLNIEAFIRALKNEYDFILIEGAALNNYADSKELSKYVDGVYTVFAADTGISQVDKVSVQFINELKEKNYGAVLNNVIAQNLDY